jgi:hypothetical protein
MFSYIHRRLAIVSLMSVFFATVSFAQQSISSSASGGPGIAAIVTMANNSEIRVDQFQLVESPGGQWITERPNRYATELYYRITKDGVAIRRVIPFQAIDSVEFKTFVARDAMYPEVRKMLVKLKDGGTIEWVHSDRSITITTASGKKERWNSFPWITGVISSGQKEQGQDFFITGFTGLARINGERGDWQATPTEIKRIRFVDSNP